MTTDIYHEHNDNDENIMLFILLLKSLAPGKNSATWMFVYW